jgi:hypothetical protein
MLSILEDVQRIPLGTNLPQIAESVVAGIVNRDALRVLGVE